MSNEAHDKQLEYTMAMTQGEAVFQAVFKVVSGKVQVCQEECIPVQLSDSELKAIHEQVFLTFRGGATSHSKNPSDDQLKKYIPGLVNNWLRKDPRLNGGTKYQPKRPGSRTGSADESVRAMRVLLSLTTDPAAKNQIQAEIDKRIAALKPKPEINTAALPESLRHLL